jgi:hypothetical protein
MILWSKSNTKAEPPQEAKTISMRPEETRYIPPDISVFGWKAKKRRKVHKTRQFMTLFSKSDFLSFCGRSTKEQILQELKRLSLLKIWSSRSYERRRVRNKCVKFSHKCWACGGEPNVLHHVIMVKNGGPNVKENIIELCNQCHEEVHPWIKSC